jgi:broad specificity phosphatase PhoE
MQQRWPDRLWIVRHGQSAGPVACDAVEVAGSGAPDRVADEALSPLGEEQAMALGRWFAGRPDAERPRVMMTSPYRPAIQTGQLIRDQGGMAALNLKIRIDERLRGQELGVETLAPGPAPSHRLQGKFYNRPLGGESWCDVILRLRSLLDTLSLHHGGDHVMIVAHERVVLSLRYVLEGLTETQLLCIEHSAEIAHCAITEYRFGARSEEDDGLVLARHNFIAPLGALATAKPGANIANLMGRRR